MNLLNENISAIKSLDNPNKSFVVVFNDGKLFLHDYGSKNTNFVIQLHFETQDIALYCFEEFVCIVQNKGLQGLVLDIYNPHKYLRIEREDYHANHCSFPIAFFRSEAQRFLIHATEWNRLDITTLPDFMLQTERIVDYETMTNYVDYFHSTLLVSPDATHFISNGWVWSPVDRISVYDTNLFFTKYEMCQQTLDYGNTSGYNWDRPVCWIDNNTLGIGYNKQEDDESEGHFVSEILFFDIIHNRLVGRIDFDGFGLDKEYGEVSGKLYFDDITKCFIGINPDTGIYSVDLQGNVLFQNREMVGYEYNAKNRFFYKYNHLNNEIEILPQISLWS